MTRVQRLRPEPGAADPFGTAALRARVLAAWAASPARFREDANAEDDAALTSYRDRALVELAQNAADAATRASLPGRLRVLVRDGVCYAANVGTPLDAAGVEALSHLRASTKSTSEVGRFGAGAKSLLVLTDDPEVHTADGGVGWSRSATRDAVSELPSLADVLADRGGAVPAMRLPWPAAPDEVVRGLLADGAATVWRLPLRDAKAAALLAEQARDLDPLLLLALPQLDAVDVDLGTASPPVQLRATRAAGVVVLHHHATSEAGQQWRTVRCSGAVPAELLADRPAEERSRTTWEVTWAALVEDGRALPVQPQAVRAPQPTDEPLTVPVVLIATLPLDASRRHVVSGPLAEHVIGTAALAYADLLGSLAAAGVEGVLRLLPQSIPGGTVDAALHEAIRACLPDAACVPAHAGPALRPREALLLDTGAATEPLCGLLADELIALVASSVSADARLRASLVDLGARVLSTADVIDLLRGLDRSAAWWVSVTEALAAAPDRDALRALPVRCADGSMAPSPRAVVLPPRDVRLVDQLSGADVRVAAREYAASDLAMEALRAAGASDGDVGTLLDALRDAVDAAWDDDPADAPEDSAPLWAAVLALAAADLDAARTRDWLHALPLPAADGELRAAEELLLPTEHGGRLADLVDHGPGEATFALVADSVVAAHGVDALVAVGVVDGFAVVVDHDVAVDPEAADHDLADEEQWLAELAVDTHSGSDDAPVPWVIDELSGLRDLDLVRDDAPTWLRALTLIGTEHLDVVRARVRMGHRDQRREALSHAAWWLRRTACVPADDGSLHRPGALADPAAEPLLRAVLPLCPPLPPAALAVVRAVGMASRLDDLDVDALRDVAEVLATSELDESALRAAHPRVARRLLALDVAPPLQVRALVDGALRTVRADEACVLDRPDLQPLLGGVPVLPAAAVDAVVVADGFALRLASECVSGERHSAASSTHRWDALPALAQVREVLGASTLADLGESYEVHAPLRLVATADAPPLAARWRAGDAEQSAAVDAEDVAHGLARALAWRCGAWESRALVESILRAPDEPARRYLVAESWSDAPAVVDDADAASASSRAIAAARRRT